MKQGPLHTAHESAKASIAEVDGWAIPLEFSDGAAVEETNACNGAGLMDLCATGTVVLEGPDARRFCNGMFTNNIRAMQPGEGNRSAMCDDRGRVQGLLDLYCTGPDRFEGVLEGVDTAWFEGRYEMYIVFDDVEMEVSAQAPWLLSLQGPKAESILQSIGLPTPEEPGHHTLSDSGIRIMKKDRTGLGGFDLLLSTEAVVQTHADLLAAGASPLGHTAFNALRIRHGRARWPVDGNEKTLVHELAINEEVCNFNKGCYLGQEVINRIDVKGQVAKKIMTMVIEGSELPPTGAEVLLGDKAIGMITSTAHSNGQSLALAVLRKKAWEPGLDLVVQAEEQVWKGELHTIAD
jgi:folate-binding protein YgfZ